MGSQLLLSAADTDGDGFSDGAEVAAGTDPLDPVSHPTTPVPALGPAGLGALVLLLLASGGARLRART